jgi:hypothetical protein
VVRCGGVATFERDIWIRQQWGWLALGLAAIASTWVVASTWERVRTRPPERTLQVTGSAKKRIVSDLIEWTGSVEVVDPADRTAAYRTLHGHVAKVLAYLKAQGIGERDVSPSSVSVESVYDAEVVGKGENRVERKIFKGYRTTQSVTIRSSDVTRIERISREVTQLGEQGVPISSSPPEYFYTKLGELKIEMLAEAAKDARSRAENMIRSAGGASIDRLRAADMGIINVNPANSTETSAQGNNDTSSLDKDIITIVHVTYELK